MQRLTSRVLHCLLRNLDAERLLANRLAKHLAKRLLVNQLIINGIK